MFTNNVIGFEQLGPGIFLFLIIVTFIFRNTQPALRTFQTGQNLKQLTTLNHLETQLAACLTLKSATEYKFWLQTYVRYLVQEGELSR